MERTYFYAFPPESKEPFYSAMGISGVASSFVIFLERHKRREPFPASFGETNQGEATGCT